MIKITSKASRKIQELIQAENRPSNTFVRVRVEGGGCSGLLYKLEFDTLVRDDEDVFEQEGVRLVVPRKSLLYLAGTELDYSDGLNGKGFQFNNPNATRTCGCGESFSV
ncbi:MAG: iron-sulfur cluster assembly accessory protein [Flavobacteriales bacterium]|nr:iron-sulfur cluster assembly accessory protein [Flavobacteriales bacterium]MCX7768992.1 iron-sulfur cluster assembly accessory protein [Flavobacteriales bacterium]MDW8410261.1 iron-sulfur cluster assembly accessory protein [Flavobacteriales bacterium]